MKQREQVPYLWHCYIQLENSQRVRKETEAGDLEEEPKVEEGWEMTERKLNYRTQKG